MKKTETEQFRQALLQLRVRCNGDISQLSDEALRKNQDSAGNLSSMPIHMADIGSENFEQEFTLGLLENEEELVVEIDAALGRLAAGGFGRCEACNKDIARERLKQIPYARYCVDCARKQERR